VESERDALVVSCGETISDGSCAVAVTARRPGRRATRLVSSQETNCFNSDAQMRRLLDGAPQPGQVGLVHDRGRSSRSPWWQMQNRTARMPSSNSRSWIVGSLNGVSIEASR